MKTIPVIFSIFCALVVQSVAYTNSLPVITNYKTVLVTNWIQPSERYCFIGQQLYDKYRSPQFITVDIPIFATVSVSYSGPVDTVVHPLTLSASWQQGGVR